MTTINPIPEKITTTTDDIIRDLLEAADALKSLREEGEALLSK